MIPYLCTVLDETQQFWTKRNTVGRNATLLDETQQEHTRLRSSRAHECLMIDMWGRTWRHMRSHEYMFSCRSGVVFLGCKHCCVSSNSVTFRPTVLRFVQNCTEVWDKVILISWPCLICYCIVVWIVMERFLKRSAPATSRTSSSSPPPKKAKQGSVTAAQYYFEFSPHYFEFLPHFCRIISNFRRIFAAYFSISDTCGTALFGSKNRI